MSVPSKVLRVKTRHLSSPGSPLVWGIALVTTTVHFAIALRHGGPVAVPDIPAYVSVTQWIGGAQLPDQLPFHPGYGMILSPVLIFTGVSGTGIHTGALLYNAFFAGAIVGMSVRLVTRLGVKGNLVIGAALISALHPSVSSSSRIGWPETLLTLCILIIANGLCSPGRRHYVAMGFISGLTISVHPRAVVLAVGLLALGILSKNLKPVLIGVLPGFALTGLALTLTNTWPIHRIEAVGNIGDGVTALTASMGQLLAVSAGTVGLAMCGFLIGGRSACTLSSKTRRGTPAEAFVAVTAFGMVVLGGLALAGGYRIDSILYGRYLDPWAIPLSLVGLSYLAKKRPHKLMPIVGLLLTMLSVWVVLISSGLVNLPLRRIMTLSLSWLWMITDHNLGWVVLIAGIFSLLGIAAMMVKSRRYLPALVALCLILSTFSTVLNQTHLNRVGIISAGQSTASGHVPDALDCLSHDVATTKSYAIWLYRMQLPGIRHEQVDLTASPSLCSDYLIASKEHLVDCEGARLVVKEPKATWGLWVNEKHWAKCF